MTVSLRDNSALFNHLSRRGEQAYGSGFTSWTDKNNEDTTQNWLGSSACLILNDIAIGLLEKNKKQKPDEQEIEDAFAVASQLVFEWRCAIASDGGKYAKRFQLWYDLLLRRSTEKIHCISFEAMRPDIEDVAGQYLNLNIRSTLAEKELLRVLIGVEYVDYYSQTHGSWEFDREVGQNWFTRLLKIDPVRREAKESFTRLIISMQDTYKVADSQGLLPIQHLKEKIDAAHDLGVVWPGALYALMSRLKNEQVEYL